MLPKEKKLFVFELDDVLFPKKDYLLQVYYLFANFLAFTDGFASPGELVTFLKNHLDRHGEKDIFEHAQSAFGFASTYKENFERLHANAVLPVPLLLFDHMKILFDRLKAEGKGICILTKGNPVEQLNKINYLDWGKYADLKIYFLDELQFRNIDPKAYIADDFGVKPDEIQFVD